MLSELRVRSVLSILALPCLLAAAPPALAAGSEAAPLQISGVARDPAGVPLAGAAVTVEGAGASAVTDSGGMWRLLLSPGVRILHVTLPGYGETVRRVRVEAGTPPVAIVLTPASRREEHVVVRAIRADADDPVTKKDIDRRTIERSNYAQEMPFLLQEAPAMTHYADSGTGSGYSYFTMRGIQQTRINMTLDGVPLNDPEESALYFSNFGDFASALGSIQIQRGVGTTSIGAASYGGSINFESLTPGDDPSADVDLDGGSFGARHVAATAQSGRLPGGFALYGRASFQESDGFRDHSGTDQKTFYFGASRSAAKSLLKIFGFSGHERSRLAYLAVEEDVLDHNLTFNPLSPKETDSFGQDFLQAQYTRFLTPSSSLALQGYYNGQQGTFRILDASTPSPSLQEIGLDGGFTGAIVSFNHDRGPLSLTAGVHSGWFNRDHFASVVGGPRLYDNTSVKNEADAFVKYGYALGAWRLFADAQMRWARFRYEGSIDLGSVSWTFFNPKVGARRAIAPGLSIYASVAKATREPTRSDMLSGEDNASIAYDLGAVRPEQVLDFETGVDLKRSGFDLSADIYAMEFHDEIALTGELSAIGLPVRRNVDRSYRHGVEWDLSKAIGPKVRLRSGGNLSINRIREWTQVYDVYDASGSFAGNVSRNHGDVPPLLSPPFTTNLALEWSPGPAALLSLSGRYVSTSNLDNTGDPGLVTPAFTVLDAMGSIGLDRLAGAGRPRFRVQVNNVLDNRKIRASGYSYQYFQENAAGGRSLQGIPYGYPLATRSVYVTIDVHL